MRSNEIDVTLSRDQLIEKYLPMARSVAVRYAQSCGRLLSKEDHTSAAFIGLCDAEKAWDRKTARFMTFAQLYVRGYVLNQIRSATGRATGAFDIAPSIAEAEERCIKKGLEPTADNLSREVVCHDSDHSRRAVARVSDADGVSEWRKAARANAAFEPLDGVSDIVASRDCSEDVVLRVVVQDALKDLPEAQRRAVWAICGEGLSAESLTDELGCSGKQVRRLRDIGLEALRNHALMSEVAKEYNYA